MSDAGVVDDLITEVANFHANRQAVVGILGVVGILRGNDDVLVGDDQRGAMLGSCLKHDRLIVAACVRQVSLVDQDGMTADVGEDRGPAVAVDVMDGLLVSDLQRVTGDGLGDEVVVIAVLDEEDAAVEDVDPVVAVLRPAGEDDGVAVGGAGVHGRAGRSDLEDAAVNVTGR